MTRIERVAVDTETYIGRVGGWGGTGDQREAPGSLANSVSKLFVDAQGNVRAVDSRENRVLLFTTPSTKP